MKIDERYEIRTVVIELREVEGSGIIPGDVYDDLQTFKKEHPFASYKFGYVVIDTETGFVPDTCRDWNDSPEDALMDYQENCQITTDATDGETMTVEITMEKTQRVAMMFNVTKEQLDLLDRGDNPFRDEMEKELESGAGDTEFNYAVCDEGGNTLVDWD